MRLLFSERAWEDDLHWQAKVEKTLERLNTLIRESSRTPLQGIGMPELLRGNLSGWWFGLVIQADHAGAPAGISGAGWDAGDYAVSVSLLKLR